MGDDTCRGTSGDDVINGELGDDFLVDSKGNDTYYIEIGDGKDTISDGSGVDRILYGEGILSEDIKVVRKGDGLYLTNALSGDSIEILNFFASEKCGIEQIEFADGTLWTTEDIWDKARYYYGTESNDNIYANRSQNEIGYEDDYIYGGAGNDVISGSAGDDSLYGELGEDTLRGENGDDVLTGGIDNDKLHGGAGNDTYIVNLNDGLDTIYDSSGMDCIVFGEGILPEQIKVTRNIDNLYLTNVISGDCLTVRNYFFSDKYNLERIEFADGTVWRNVDIQERARYYYGTEADDNISAYDNNKGTSREDDYIYAGAGNDVLRGNSGQDMLAGENGDDTLFGDSGADVLVGGTGDDILQGGSGNDTYRIELGDGNDFVTEVSGTDCLVFGKEILKEDIIVTRDTSNLYLTNKVSGDCVTVKNYFTDACVGVERIEFADGTVWNTEDVRDKARCYYGTEADDNIHASNDTCGIADEDNQMYGGAGNDRLNGVDGQDTLYGELGNDSLNGGSGDDILVGGVGNDTLQGNSGNDIYIINPQDGNDTIYD